MRKRGGDPEGVDRDPGRGDRDPERVQRPERGAQRPGRGGQGPRGRGAGTQGEGDGDQRERDRDPEKGSQAGVVEPSQAPTRHKQQTWKISKPAMSRMPRKEAPCRGLRSRALLRRRTSQRKRRSYVALASASSAKSACGAGHT